MPNPKILIIEDESITALAIKHKLERLGYSVLAIESCGKGAIEKTQDLKPDLILMDIVLQGEMDGIEAAQKINKKFKIPIVYLTAYSDDETIERAKLTLPYGYINKPFNDGDLKGVIETALYKYEIECKLKENEENLNAFLNSLNEPAFLIDLEGNIQYINRYTENMLGNVVNDNIYDVSPPEKALFRKECVEKAIKTGETVSFEDENNGKFTEIRIYPISNKKGEVSRLSIIGIDISDLKKIEETLRESEEKYRRIVETANEGIWAMDQNFKTTFVNQKMAEMLGYTIEEMIGTLVTSYMFTEDIENHNSKMGARKKGISEHYERRFKHKNGSEIWTNVSVKALQDERNNFAGSFAMFTDITQHKKAQKSLEYSENKFRELFDNISSGVAVYEATNNGSDFIFKDFNNTAVKIDSLKKEDVIGKSVLELFPKVKDFGLYAVMQRVWKTGTPEHFPVSFYEDKRITGWRENYIYKLPSGEIVAVYDDITKRKEAEKSLKENEKYMETILATIQTGIVVIDAKTKEIIDINRAAINLIDAQKDEIIGKKCHKFICPAEEGQCPIIDLNQEIDNSEKILLTANGDEIPIIKSVVHITLKGRECLLDSFIDIRELKKLEKSLKESKERYKALIQASPEAVIVTDIKGNINFVSPKIVELCGFEKKEDFIGKNALEFISPECHKKVESETKKILEYGFNKNLEFKFIKKDGTSFTGEINLSLIKDDKKCIKSLVCTLRDITETKKAKNKLIESEAKYRNLYSSMNEGVALHKLVYDENDEPVDYIILDVNPAFEEIISLNKENIIGKKATDIYNISNPPYIDIYSKVANSGIPTTFETYFEPMDKYFSISVFSPKEGEFATIFDDITKRKKAENALKESESYYKTIFENTGTATIIVEEDTTVSLMNSESEKLCGYSKDEMEGKMSWKTFVKADFIPKLEEYHYQRRIDPNLAPRNYEFKLINKNKKIKDVFATVAIIPGTKKSLISILDITENKKSRKALRESEKEYRQLVENAHEGIWTINLDAITTLVNPRMAEMLGYSIEEIVGKPIFSFIDEKYIEIVEKYLKNPETHIKGHYDFELIRKDGKNIYISIEISPILNDDGANIGILAMVSDITDRKKAEEKLKEANIYHQGLIEASQDPLLTIGTGGKITDVNSTTENITGYSRKELIGTDFSEYFTDPQKAREGYQRVFNEGKVKDYELEIKNKNGKATSVSYNASVYKDNEGNIIGVFAAARDITEIKNAEESIKTSLKEKEVLLREIHHRVKNNLQIISSLLSLQSNYIDDEESFEVFTESQNRVKSMAMIHEKLYKSESIAKIDFRDYINDLTENLLYNYKISPNMIKLNKNIDNIFFDINTAIPCGLIINELVTNCLKHAFPWFKSPKSLKETSENLEFGKYKIDIELKENGENYTLVIADNGVGFPKEINFRETDSLGLQLVNNLVEQLDGNISLESNRGTTFRINFNEMNYEERL